MELDFKVILLTPFMVIPVNMIIVNCHDGGAIRKMGLKGSQKILGSHLEKPLMDTTSEVSGPQNFVLWGVKDEDGMGF